MSEILSIIACNFDRTGSDGISHSERPINGAEGVMIESSSDVRNDIHL